MIEKYRHPQISTVGLVANYKLWAGLTATAKVFDYAQNGHLGIPVGTNISQAYPGFTLNGTDDTIGVASGPSSVSTILIWVKPDGAGPSIGLNPTDYLYINTDTLTKSGFAGGTTVLYVDGDAGTGVTANWHLIGITDTVAKNAIALFLGSKLAVSFMAGKIGETWLYDRVLTSADMKSAYALTKWRYPNN